MACVRAVPCAHVTNAAINSGHRNTLDERKRARALALARRGANRTGRRIFGEATIYKMCTAQKISRARRHGRPRNAAVAARPPPLIPPFPIWVVSFRAVIATVSARPSPQSLIIMLPRHRHHTSNPPSLMVGQSVPHSRPTSTNDANDDDENDTIKSENPLKTISPYRIRTTAAHERAVHARVRYVCVCIQPTACLCVQL